MLTRTDTRPANWHPLYRIGGAAALILLAYSLVTMLIMIAWGPPPESVEAVFAMLHANEIQGLLRLDLLTVLCLPLYYLLFLGLYAALERTHPTYTAVATLLGCVGVTLFLATPSALSLVPLSDRFAAATVGLVFPNFCMTVPIPVHDFLEKFDTASLCVRISETTPLKSLGYNVEQGV